MRKILTIIFLVPLIAEAQYFTGEITYVRQIIPKSDTVDVSKIESFGDSIVVSYIITAKNYRSTYFKEGKYNYSYTYNEEDKRMYDDYEGKEYITFRDSRKYDVKYPGSVILKDSLTNILGYDCFLVTSRGENSTSKKFYSDKIKVDYSQFEGHKVGNWYDQLKEVDGALTIKTITEYDTHFEVQEAVKIEERKVKRKEFRLPDKPIAASFSSLDRRVQLRQPTQQQIQCYQEKVFAKSNPDGEKFTSYISFLLQKDGTIKFVKPVEEDDQGFYKVAVDVVKTCQFQFDPGLIDGKPVDTEMYFPVEFRK